MSPIIFQRPFRLEKFLHISTPLISLKLVLIGLKIRGLDPSRDHDKTFHGTFGSSERVRAYSTHVLLTRSMASSVFITPAISNERNDLSSVCGIVALI